MAPTTFAKRNPSRPKRDWTIAGAVIGGVAAIVAAWITYNGSNNNPVPPPVTPTTAAATPAPPSIRITPDAGKAKAAVVIGGAGFAPGEQIEITIGGGSAETTSLGNVHADEKGTFAGKTVYVPNQFSAYAPTDLTITATGQISAKATFHLR